MGFRGPHPGPPPKAERERDEVSCPEIGLHKKLLLPL